MTVLLAFTTEHASRVTSVSERRIRHWDKTNVLHPTLSADEPSARQFGRIYSFRDLVGLKTLGELRDRYHFPLQKLRRIGEWLTEEYESPWSSLKFWVIGTGSTADIVFRDVDRDLLLSGSRRGQSVMETIELQLIAKQTEAAANRLVERNPNEYGKINQNRYVLHNMPVMAGTRIPTTAIWDFHSAGYGTEAILREYPRLTPLDIESALSYEQNRREPKAS